MTTIVCGLANGVQALHKNQIALKEEQAKRDHPGNAAALRKLALWGTGSSMGGVVAVRPEVEQGNEKERSNGGGDDNGSGGSPKRPFVEEEDAGRKAMRWQMGQPRRPHGSFSGDREDGAEEGEEKGIHYENDRWRRGHPG